MFLFVEKYTLFPGEGNGNQLQYSCLENSMDRGAWWATVHKVTKSWTQLSTHTHAIGHKSTELSVGGMRITQQQSASSIC